MTAAELAIKTGINKSSISRYLSGENIPRSLAIGKMAKALDVKPAWVLGYEVSMDNAVEAEAEVISLENLSEINKEKIKAYYQALLDSQEG
jgi:transcriptional regulator with XRE-family HTH domain